MYFGVGVWVLVSSADSVVFDAVGAATIWAECVELVCVDELSIVLDTELLPAKKGTLNKAVAVIATKRI
jgi:hypothetical protein